MMLKVILFLACLLQLSTLHATAFDFAPYRVRNLLPTDLVRSVASADPARLVAVGEYKVSFDLDLANLATTNNSAAAQIHLDGETLQETLGMRYGMNENIQIGFDLSWVNHKKGSLDGFIEDWHDFFGLPAGDRDELPDDDLSYRYQRNGEELFNIDHSANGLGDLRLQLSWQLATSQPMASALHLTVKVPTGAADKMTGNEGWGVNLSLAHDYRITLDDGASASFWGGLGGSWLEDGDVLAEQAENWAANAWLGAGWSPNNWLALKLQMDGQTALYESDLEELGDPALILTIGGTIALTQKTFLDLAVEEDLAVNSSPDVSFHLGLSHFF
ncbi:Protein of unknown function [Desulfuromusa kysingii]|uniref:DUF3187 family protein n=1 Tax=Desulfuromusa kysingii TaxID=37625 RepID=A0A1H3ZIG4_9BACT|nr:DUF3187 family protein [Desulfuromusa kysingii]SEA23513.1 Protein of unknown function [Desulfuromusa kysingii]